jgi:hypothetical protein
VSAVVIAIALLALPPVQAAADQLLKIFRVQEVVFVPVSQERMQQLEQLNFDESTLFVTEPERVNTPAEPRTVASAQEAEGLVGYPVAQLAPEGGVPSEIVVHDRGVYQFQVNVAAARELLQLAGVTNVQLPDALGEAPITADMAPTVITRYQGQGYTVTLAQGRSPQVTVPEGVELSQLGSAMLQLLGTSPDQAQTLSQQIDWSTTFVFPFPADMSGVRPVEVRGTKGLLVSGRSEGERNPHLYWQDGDRFYVLEASGDIREADFLALAESVR